MTEPAREPPRLEFLLGSADDVRAEAYVRLVGSASAATISGTLVGPRCVIATTLPTTIPLRALAAPGPAAARAVVTEPSYWTPDLPNLYALTAEARDAAGVVAATRRLVGLRRLGLRGRSIWLDGRRWVPRGEIAAADVFDPHEFRTHDLVAVVNEPPEDVCAAADAAGVAIVARVAGDSAGTIPTLAQHPSVVVTVVDAGEAAAAAAADGRGTMLLAVEVDGGVPPPAEVPSGIQCLVVRLDANTVPAEVWRESAPAVPLVAWRAHGQRGRTACDGLQADLAGWACAGGRRPGWDWAGYLVS
ncbi:MAG: hypothetical protein EBZ74_07530 [Planctomycetia bacterium]|nr:hypothetical protein [Planctomycetia bacterium]